MLCSALPGLPVRLPDFIARNSRSFQKPALSSKVIEYEASFIASNCWSRFHTNFTYDRDAVVKELMLHIKVASYGACLKNMETFEASIQPFFSPLQYFPPSCVVLRSKPQSRYRRDWAFPQ